MTTNYEKQIMQRLTKDLFDIQLLRLIALEPIERSENPVFSKNLRKM